MLGILHQVTSFNQDDPSNGNDTVYMSLQLHSFIHTLTGVIFFLLESISDFLALGKSLKIVT